jgi:hypothetical protein
MNYERRRRCRRINMARQGKLRVGVSRLYTDGLAILGLQFVLPHDSIGRPCPFTFVLRPTLVLDPRVVIGSMRTYFSHNFDSTNRLLQSIIGYVK